MVFLFRFCLLVHICWELDVQSVYSEQKVNALVASFVHLPIGENIDWRLSATIAPCHVTVISQSLGE